MDPYHLTSIHANLHVNKLEINFEIQTRIIRCVGGGRYIYIHKERGKREGGEREIRTRTKKQKERQRD